jgi:uncharacterized protein YdeI (YjbR/CyaY-like superfamily)
VAEDSLFVSEDFRHRTPQDIAEALDADPELKAKWDGLTALGRNEWICWTTTVKSDETRRKHLSRLIEEVGDGKRRPCCWPGCPHRNEKAARYF